MQELSKVTLGNEMDLILAHKRSMKLGELSGLSLPAQTTFATAVSEVSRTAIATGKKGCLTLCVDNSNRENYVVASITHEGDTMLVNQGLENAKRLVDKHEISHKGNETTVNLFFYVSNKVDQQRIDEWRSSFRNERPVSAYDEIKRKNEQLQDLAEKIKQSEEQYKSLTDTLPILIFTIDETNYISYSNKWLTDYTGYTIAKLNLHGWAGIIHPDDYAQFNSFLGLKESYKENTRMQCRLKNHRSGEYLWHMFSLSKQKDLPDNVNSWTGFLADIHAQKLIEETLQDNRQLKDTQSRLRQNEQILELNIQELNRSNQELQQFAYIASHDLQEPARKLLFYSDYLLTHYEKNLDPKGMSYLNNLVNTAQRMRSLIRDLLIFSQVNQTTQRFEVVDLGKIFKNALFDLELQIHEKQAVILPVDLPEMEGDRVLLQQLFLNLLSNSIKYAREGVPPTIELTYKFTDKFITLYFRDNGIGFDEKYSDKMFALFQRLHSREHSPGTGLGLAICRKITDLHNGTIMGISEPGEGATFIVTLPVKQRKAVT